jgi:hypothetical protein
MLNSTQKKKQMTKNPPGTEPITLHQACNHVWELSQGPAGDGGKGFRILSLSKLKEPRSVRHLLVYQDRPKSGSFQVSFCPLCGKDISGGFASKPKEPTASPPLPELLRGLMKSRDPNFEAQLLAEESWSPEKEVVRIVRVAKLRANDGHVNMAWQLPEPALKGNGTVLVFDALRDLGLDVWEGSFGSLHIGWSGGARAT